MTQIKLKRVYDDVNDEDGYRVLVDRLWPRGINKEQLHYDLWAKEITPSSGLRKWFHIDPMDRWKDFIVMYEKELDQSSYLKSFTEDIRTKKTVTLLYASRDAEHNHAKILKSYLERLLSKG